MTSTCLCASTIARAAAFRCVVLTFARTAPRHLKEHTTRPDSLWGARVSARQASHPTRTIPQIAAGSYNTAGTCPSSGVQYYSYFKSVCSNTYIYLEWHVVFFVPLVEPSELHHYVLPLKNLLQGDVLDDVSWIHFGIG
ncbi:hypothetical protein H4582DRAFT_1279703 [Lactarius indigo]|nr:hypothetical protein H4582DRAFT_1279703 [Lactarius indigo]